MSKSDQELTPVSFLAEAGEPWVKPEVTSYAPVSAAQGSLSAKPGDGLSNLS